MISKKIYSNLLEELGVVETERNEILAYNENFFKHSDDLNPDSFPILDEPFVSAWERYVEETQYKGAFETLKARLVQFKFPIEKGISENRNYRGATRRGISTENMPEARGLSLEYPEKFELSLYQTPAGKIPLLITRHRQDFVTLVRALSCRNEPKEIPPSMGACMVKGFNNWDRIWSYKKKWQENNPQNSSETHWQEEFKSMIPKKGLYQDRFIILSDGEYSGIPAEKMKLSKQEWKKLSLVIRREHEVTHYFTERVLGSARNNILDELIADYMGIVDAYGSYRADWFLRFIGLEDYPNYRDGGRLQNYLGKSPISPKAFKTLQTLVKRACENLEEFHKNNVTKIHTKEVKIKNLLALTKLTLIDIASEKFEEKILKIM